MAVNKVVYGKNTLIDLSSDTVTVDNLLFGYKAHDKSGAIITGTFLKGFPASFSMTDTILDSSGATVYDSSSKALYGTYVYRR